MDQLRKFYDSVLENKTLQSEVTKAKDTFKPRPFVAEWRRLKLLLTFAHPLFSLFSVVTGTAFLYFLFASQLPKVLAGFLAIGTLLVIEIGKNFFANLTAKKLFLKSKQVPFLAVLTLPLFGLSIFLSLKGTDQLYSNLDESKVELSAKFTTQKDSVNRAYDSLTNIETLAFLGFQESVSWNGKINVHNPAVRERMNANTSRLERYQTDKGKALSALDAEHQKAEKVRIEDTGFESVTWIVASAINETLILLSIFGLVWYAFRVSQENEALTEAETYTLSTDNLQALVQTIFMQGNAGTFIPVGLPNGDTQSPYTSSNIPSVGFQFGNTRTNDHRKPSNDGRKSPNDNRNNESRKEGKEKHPNDSRNNESRKLDNGNRICEHCGSVYVYRSWNQKYCSTTCRVSAWEEKTGRKLNKGKKA